MKDVLYMIARILKGSIREFLCILHLVEHNFSLQPGMLATQIINWVNSIHD